MVRAQGSVRGDDDAKGTIDTRKFFDGGDIFDVSHAGAAKLNRKNHAHEAELAEFFDCGEREVAGVVPLAEDRKSTRLNSSHVKISYAVFCLKKKKQRL